MLGKSCMHVINFILSDSISSAPIGCPLNFQLFAHGRDWMFVSQLGRFSPENEVLSVSSEMGIFVCGMTQCHAAPDCSTIAIWFLMNSFVERNEGTRWDFASVWWLLIITIANVISNAEWDTLVNRVFNLFGNYLAMQEMPDPADHGKVRLVVCGCTSIVRRNRTFL